jgi:hypothetical protein
MFGVIEAWIAAAVVSVALLSAGSALGAGGLSWSAPKLVDQTAPLGDPVVWGRVSCPSAELCVNVGIYTAARSGNEFSAVATTKHPAPGSRGWQTSVGIGPGAPVGVSCPSVSLCVAVESAAVVGQSNAIAASTNPTGGRAAWKVAKLHAALLTGISCPTVSLCVALDGGVGVPAVFTSTDPGGKLQSWKKTALPGGNGDTSLNAISCTASLLCVAVGDQGQIAVSTNPTGGPGAWKLATMSGAPSLVAVACPSSSLCVAADGSGDVVTSKNPTGGAPAWQTNRLDPSSVYGLEALSCTAAGFCVAGDSEGRVFASADPAAGPAAWNVTPGVDTSDFSGVACASASLCVATDVRGGVLVSSAPASTPAPWSRPAELSGTTALPGLSCPSVSFCVAVDDIGKALTTTRPGSRSAWHAAVIGAPVSLSSVSCPRSRFCVAVGADDAVATSTNPLGGPGSWRAAQLGLKDYQQNNRNLSSVSCASPSLCVATADEQLAVSTNPTGGAAAWRSLAAGDPFDGTYIGNQFDSVSCPSVKLCVAGDNIVGAGIAVSTTPRTARAWRFVRVGSGITGVSCPSSTFCVAVDRKGDVLSTNKPAGRARAWRVVRIDRGHGLADVSCASAKFCAVIDVARGMFVSTNPRGGARNWRPMTVDRGNSRLGLLNGPLAAISCPSARMCVASDLVGNVIVGR